MDTKHLFDIHDKRQWHLKCKLPLTCHKVKCGFSLRDVYWTVNLIRVTCLKCKEA